MLDLRRSYTLNEMSVAKNAYVDYVCCRIEADVLEFYDDLCEYIEKPLVNKKYTKLQNLVTKNMLNDIAIEDEDFTSLVEVFNNSENIQEFSEWYCSKRDTPEEYFSFI